MQDLLLKQNGFNKSNSCTKNFCLFSFQLLYLDHTRGHLGVMPGAALQVTSGRLKDPIFYLTYFRRKQPAYFLCGRLFLDVFIRYGRAVRSIKVIRVFVVNLLKNEIKLTWHLRNIYGEHFFY